MAVATANKRLAALTAAGTSIWLDQLRRGMIEDGELKHLIEEDCLRGVTSNPAIFEKAMMESSDYDSELEQLAREGLTAREIYRRLAVRDVQMAADALRPVYEETNHVDGYVSLEVAPRLAHDARGTFDQAKEYWELVDRPNLMIKIPGTEEGLWAIEEALFAGLNVNVTLLFSVKRYHQVMDAFLRAMNQRHADRRPLDCHSVASFFVSRVDTEVDERLEKLGRTDLQGTAGLANARLAYHAFKEVFEGERFEVLKRAGCPVQRPLWASTGVKNPAYDETMYVYGLVGRNTINTMPLPTLQAAAQPGEVAKDTAEIDPTAQLNALKEAGIDLDDVTDKLLRDGIDKFIQPMNKLLTGLEQRRERIVLQVPQMMRTNLPSGFDERIKARIERAQKEDVVGRIWRKDATLWAPAGTPEVANRLGWLTISEQMLGEVEALKSFAADCRAAGYSDAVLLGMGGSSLAAEVFRRTYEGEAKGLRLHVLDSTDPDQIAAIEAEIDLDHTLFIVSTKSGGTIETLSLFEYFYSRQPNGEHFIAITDPGTALVDIASKHNFRRVFLGDPDIGGRYSALSYFGLVPAVLLGVDIEAILRSAEEGRQNCQDPDPQSNAGLWLGIALGELALGSRDKVTLYFSEPIKALAVWAEQLIAESTGKLGRGLIPIADEPLGAPERYGNDRVFRDARIEGESDAELVSAIDALAQAGQATITVTLGKREDIGRFFFAAEFVIAVAGWVLGINPFDQPNVAEAKEKTQQVLAEGTVEPATADFSDIPALISMLEPPRYFAIMAYLPFSSEVDEAIARLRSCVRDRTGVATTFGYGPRFLHSTGQLHKGGPATGVFLQLVHEGREDREIPGKEFTFRRLITAQADGDLETLQAHELSVARIRLDDSDLAGGIDELTAFIEGIK